MNLIWLEAHRPPFSKAQQLITFSPSIRFALLLMHPLRLLRRMDAGVFSLLFCSSTSVQIYLNANGPPVYSSGGADWAPRLIDPSQATRGRFHKSLKCILASLKKILPCALAINLGADLWTWPRGRVVIVSRHTMNSSTDVFNEVWSAARVSLPSSGRTSSKWSTRLLDRSEVSLSSNRWGSLRLSFPNSQCSNYVWQLNEDCCCRLGDIIALSLVSVGLEGVWVFTDRCMTERTKPGDKHRQDQLTNEGWRVDASDG